MYLNEKKKLKTPALEKTCIYIYIYILWNEIIDRPSTNALINVFGEAVGYIALPFAWDLNINGRSQKDIGIW